MKCKVLTFVLTLTLCTQGVRAQMGKLFDADKQLSSSFINQVYQDHDGFVWAVTRNGLCRYDGYKFLILKKEATSAMPDGSMLASNYVNQIVQDRQGLFYIGMYGALQTYDGNSFRDVVTTDLDGHAVPCYITCFAERQTGQMLVGTSGHGVLLMDSPTAAHELGGDLAAIETVHRMMEDSRGRLWIVTADQGVVVCEEELVTATYFTAEDLRHSVRRVCEDREGRIYIGTSETGAYRLEADGQFHHLEATAGRHITELYCGCSGQIYMGFDGGGVGVFDPQSGRLTDNPYYSREVDLEQAKVVSIVEDQRGNLWLGMLQKGLYMQPGTPHAFGYMGYKLGEHNIIGQACVTSTIIDSRGCVWVGTDKDGLYQIGPDRQLRRHYKDHFPATILTMTEDGEGHIWVGSYMEGCGYIDPATGQYHRQHLPQGERVSVFGVEADGQGRLWMATMGQGLLCLNVASGDIRQYTTQPDAPSDRTINSLTNDYIPKLSLSPDGRRVYLATTMGVCCLDIETDSWVNVLGQNCLKYGMPTRIVKEYGGRLWIGTNDGLYCYDLLSRQLELLTTESGLADNGISSIEQDQNGRLWMGTDHGLCCYDPATGQSESYFVDNGLQSNEFSDGASFFAPLLSPAMMLFGGVGGITWFDPTTLSQPEWEADVKLIGFIVNGQPVSSQTRSERYQVCDTTVIAANRFHLAYQENHFSLQLSTLTFDNPEHITYLYSINGEPYTSLPRGVNEITFTHLSPGTYHFSIKAERNNLLTAVREFTVVVHAPWYRTWWAYLLYVLLAAVALWQYLLMRRRKERSALRLQEHIHAEEMSEARLRFFMNISHEIRTPMTLIHTPLLSLLKSEADPQRRGIYETMRRNADRILNLINQMMDLRKIDKGMMQIHLQPTDLVAFIGDLHTLFEHQARAKHITFTFNHTDDALTARIDPGQFDKVIVNILSNAFKFTPAGGTIGIDLSRLDGQAVIAISDDGDQIPDDKLEHIFERFYQVPSADAGRVASGTGIGLDLARSLVELHHGTIKAQNLERGCQFVVTIPVGEGGLVSGEGRKDLPVETILPSPLTPAGESDGEGWLMRGEGRDDLAAENILPSPLTPHSSPNSKQKLVIAEDDEEIRQYLVSELSADFEVLATANGREALALTLRRQPALVLSDVMMPEMDGNTLCATLKGNPQTSHIPVVLLTALGSEDDQLDGLDTGADAYLVKPFNIDILRRTILNLMHSRQQLRMKYGRTDLLEQQVDRIEVQSPDAKLLERVMKVINKNLRNSDLSVDFIAQEVGISRVHLHRKMKELTGQTPHDFIRNLRLKQAANLLASGDMNVTEVVYACGFGNVTSFSTTFKKFYGMSPREYMQEHQRR